MKFKGREIVGFGEIYGTWPPARVYIFTDESWRCDWCDVDFPEGADMGAHFNNVSHVALPGSERYETLMEQGRVIL